MEVTLSKPETRLSVYIANNNEDILAAQQLRFRVFRDDFGLRFTPALSRLGLDIDEFDACCDHLIVKEEISGRVVGTYRILSPQARTQFGLSYTGKIFNTSALVDINQHTVEIGRSCTDPNFRNGAVITLLWKGLADYLSQHNMRYMLGCASIPLRDGGHNAANLYRQMAANEELLCPPNRRIYPVIPLPIEVLGNNSDSQLPPLIRSYIRAGAWLCGAPAFDEAFNCADLPLLLSLERLSDRFRRHFIKDTPRDLSFEKAA